MNIVYWLHKAALSNPSLKYIRGLVHVNVSYIRPLVPAARRYMYTRTSDRAWSLAIPDAHRLPLSWNRSQFTRKSKVEKHAIVYALRPPTRFHILRPVTFQTPEANANCTYKHVQSCQTSGSGACSQHRSSASPTAQHKSSLDAAKKRVPRSEVSRRIGIPDTFQAPAIRSVGSRVWASDIYSFFSERRSKFTPHQNRFLQLLGESVALKAVGSLIKFCIGKAPIVDSI